MNRLEKAPALWLICAALCALMWSLPLALGLMTGEMPTAWNPARWAFAFYGALIYGWALPDFSMPQPAKLIWHACVGLGMTTIAVGQGSGFLVMPFAPWIAPVFAVLLVLSAVQSLHKAQSRDRQSVECSVPVGIAVCLLAVWWSDGLGFNSLLGLTVLESSICFLTALYGVWRIFIAPLKDSTGIKIFNVSLALLALSAPFIGGLAVLKGMPAPLCLVEAGGVWWCLCSLAMPAMVFTLFRRGNATHPSVLAACVLLVLLCCVPLIPGDFQLGLSAWYYPALWLLPCACLRPQAVSGQLSHCSKPLLIAAGILLICCVIAVLGVIDANAFTLTQRGKILCEWTQVCSCLVLLAAPFIAQGGFVSLRDAMSPPAESKNSLIPTVCVPAVVLILTLLTVLLHAPTPSPLEVKRPAQDAEGARIYAAEGCALCHTQLIKRLPSGQDLKMAFERSSNPDFLCRVTEPEDFDMFGNREGAAQVGRAAVGPDLSNAVEYLKGRLTYENALTEQDELAAQPREWLALHLYHPAEQRLGVTWSICPAMTGVFETRRFSGSKPSADALPVRTEPGYEVVPTARGRHLLTYLESLYRPPLTPKKGMEHLKPDTRHIDAAYVDHTTAHYTAKLAEKRAALALKKGRDIFLNKCSICHGRDGMGDKINYPPLKDSDWLKEKSDKELVDLILNGLSGPIVVNGRKWDSTMLPPGVTDARDIARLITFLRKHFVNVDRPLTEKDAETLKNSSSGK